MGRVISHGPFDSLPFFIQSISIYKKGGVLMKHQIISMVCCLAVAARKSLGNYTTTHFI